MISMVRLKLKFSTTVILLLAIALTACGGNSDSSSNSSKTKESKKEDDQLTVMFVQRNPVEYKPKSKKKLVTFKDYLSAAKEAEEQKAYEECLEFSRKAIKLKKDSGIAHYYCGKSLLYTIKGSVDESIKEFERAIELGFEKADLYENLAVLYNGKKQYGKTIKVLSRAIEISPRHKGLYKFRGSVYRQLGEIDKAEYDYTMQIKLSGRFSSGGYFNRATFYASLGRYNEALNDYRESIKTGGKKSFYSRKKCAEIYIKLNRVDDAIEELTKIIEIDPRDDDSYRLRGNMFEKKGENIKALTDYNESVSINPEFARTSYLARASLYEKMGKSDKAERDRKMASAIHNKPAEKTLYKISDE